MAAGSRGLRYGAPYGMARLSRFAVNLGSGVPKRSAGQPNHLRVDCPRNTCIVLQSKQHIICLLAIPAAGKKLRARFGYSAPGKALPLCHARVAKHIALIRMCLHAQRPGICAGKLWAFACIPVLLAGAHAHPYLAIHLAAYPSLLALKREVGA